MNIREIIAFMCDCEVCFWVYIAMQPFVFSKVVEEFRLVLLEIDGEIRADIVFAKCMVQLVISDVNIYLCLQGLTCGLDLGGLGLVLGRCGLLWDDITTAGSIRHRRWDYYGSGEK